MASPAMFGLALAGAAGTAGVGYLLVQPDVQGIVLLDREAREGGVAIDLGEGPVAPVLPVAVEDGTEIWVSVPAGKRRLRVEGEVLVTITGLDADVAFWAIGDDVAADRFLAEGTEHALDALADAIGAKIEVRDVEVAEIRADDALLVAALSQPIPDLRSIEPVWMAPHPVEVAPPDLAATARRAQGPDSPPPLAPSRREPSRGPEGVLLRSDGTRYPRPALTLPPGPLLVHVWLQACSDCWPAFRALRALNEAKALEGIAVMNVAFGAADPDWAAEWTVAENLQFDPDGSGIVRPFGITTFTSFVFDCDGQVRFVGRPGKPGFVEGVRAAEKAVAGEPACALSHAWPWL